MKNKFLFLDIDNTLCYRTTKGNYHKEHMNDEVHSFDDDITIMRPHLKQFFNFVFDKFGCKNVGLSTNATSVGASNFFRSCINLNILSREQYNEMRLNVCHSGNTPNKEITIGEFSGIQIKDFEQASKNVGCEVKDVILIDDWKDKDNPYNEHIIGIPFYMGEKEDKELLTIIKKIKNGFHII